MPISKEWLTFLQEQYPVGSRVRIREMDDLNSELMAGISGALEQIDEDGRFHLKLENGESAVLTVGRDKFSILPPEPVTLKLYMPLTADLFEYDEYRDLATTPSLLYSGDLLTFTGEIQEALFNNRMQEESERGIMHWYSDNDTVNEKVQSVVFNAEVRDGRLWGVAECRVMGQLTPDELFTLKEYITGQASDGWGEGFEQRDIRTEEGELYVHLWSFHSDWSIETEEECFGPQFAEGLPEMCFSVSRASGELICLKRGESGYYPSQYNTSDREQNETFARHYNEVLGVTSQQRQAMEFGSLFGWNLPGADPKTYEQHQEQQMGGMTFG
ncbi:MAG: DUF4314 domain-containing protein [Oscillospiraceae bacterium]|nr:DUF4314 domain-containing protein [Oscillospiraceae bacterium]